MQNGVQEKINAFQIQVFIQNLYKYPTFKILLLF